MSELLGTARVVGLDATRMYYVTLCSATKLRVFHCEHVHKMPHPGLDPSMFISFLCTTEADWIDLRCRVAELFSNHKTGFANNGESPSWSDGDKSRIVVGSRGRGRYARWSRLIALGGEGAVIGNRLSLRADYESGKCGGGTEVDPVSRVTPSAGLTISSTSTTPHSSKATPVVFSQTISSNSAVFDDEEWVHPTPILGTPLKPASPALSPSLPPIAKTRSSSGAKSRKRKEGRAHVSVPSNAAGGAQEDRPRRVPQMSSARGRDGRTQSGGVTKGITAPDLGSLGLTIFDGDDI